MMMKPRQMRTVQFSLRMPNLKMRLPSDLPDGGTMTIMVCGNNTIRIAYPDRVFYDRSHHGKHIVYSLKRCHSRIQCRSTWRNARLKVAARTIPRTLIGSRLMNGVSTSRPGNGQAKISTVLITSTSRMAMRAGTNGRGISLIT
jgi:hypothetical protein